MQRNQHRAGSRDLRCSAFTRYIHPDLREATSKALCSGHTLNLTSTGLQADACSPSLHPTKQDQVGVSLCRLTLISGAGRQFLQLRHSHMREDVEIPGV